MIFIVLLIFLAILLVILVKQLHIHVSTKDVERKVSTFLAEHLEAHKAKTIVTKKTSLKPSTKKNT